MTRREERGGGPETRQVIDELRRTLRAAKVRRLELERKLGWSNGYVSRLLKGTIELRATHLFAILGALEIPPAVFFERVYPPEQEPIPVGEEFDQRVRDILQAVLRELLRRFRASRSSGP